MVFATGGISKWTRSRDDIITRALRIIQELGTGETASSARVTECAAVLNDMIQSWNADGMPLWKVTNGTAITYTATKTYTIGIGQTTNQVAPLKILSAWNRDASVAAYPVDSPIILVPKMDYDILGSKNATGRPNQLFYLSPGAGTGAAGATTDLVGTITVFTVPDAYTIANVTLVFVGQYPFQDFNASTDVPDFPPYWYNALVWGLADELCYESGTPYAERSMIAKKAMEQRGQALSFGTEEGSLQITPGPLWAHDGRA